ncbi:MULTISPECIES: hypothetical protein [Bradyrhizobium]|jgi:hypothetical protein|uniref:Secreted protein n=1 Tax=Bradyrhizobium diversitatis TaxID=2755406 RepID=A0ABS0PAY2_9BRAD|nr:MULTISPECIES: hypothetical protein [Bradyrhizobium]KYK46399.1 hypothetical protein A1D31_32375 [Bradyrhizobium liaoningense]MBH5390466.1 hypothetical protein [Bradyrhizobium diversitatis]UPJ66219.1 hypothetical protein IVB23_02220 [Bradyrhizobium sp. 191]
MKKIMVAASLVVLLCGAAVAQPNGSKGSTSTGASRGTVWPAPVGHRQPRAADVPSEKNLSDPNTAANKEDAELDRKIRSICRGC